MIFDNFWLVYVLIFYHPENTRNPLVFWSFQGVENGNICQKWVNPFQPSVAFCIETSHLISFVNQMTSFYMESNTALKLVNQKNVMLFPVPFSCERF